MPRGYRRRGGTTVTDVRRDGMGVVGVAPSPVTDEGLGYDAKISVYNKLLNHSSIDEVTAGLATKARTAIYTLLSAKVVG